MFQLPGLAVGSSGGISPAEKLSRFISVENEWNILKGLEDPTLIPACTELGVGIIPYRPLASGVLTGKYRPDESPGPGTRLGDSPRMRGVYSREEIAAVQRVSAWAKQRGQTTTQIAVAALLTYPQVSTVIVGARAPEQVIDNARLAEVRLGEAERDQAIALLHSTASTRGTSRE